MKHNQGQSQEDRVTLTPLKVGTHGIHLAQVDGDAAVLDEGLLGVVELGGAVPPCVVGDPVVDVDLVMCMPEGKSR